MSNARRTKAASLLLAAGLTVLGAACADDDGADDTTTGTTDGTTAGTTTAGTTADTTTGGESPAEDESPAADTTTTDS